MINKLKSMRLQNLILRFTELLVFILTFSTSTACAENLKENISRVEIIEPHTLNSVYLSKLPIVGGMVVNDSWHSDKSLLINIHCSKSFRKVKECIVVLVENLYQTNTPKPEQKIRDAFKLKINGSLGVFDSDDRNCTSLQHPNESIIVVGQQHWRKDRRNGGYVKPIVNSWIVDLTTERFVQIDTESVTCDFNDNRD